MALIGKIRNNSWILIVMIALGLGGFILMDMTSGQQSVFGSGQTTMAEINGNPIDINEFSRTEQIVYGGQQGDTYAQRNALWNYYMESILVREEAAEIGLGVSKDELIDLQFGNNLSPIITSRFRNQTTNQVDRQRLAEFQQAIQNNDLRPDLRQFWAHQENEVIVDRLKTKLIEMTTAAMYIPTWQAEMLGNLQNEKMDFEYVQIPFASVDDAGITLTEADFEAYLEENKATYESEEETRRVAYVEFNVSASAADSAEIRQEVASLVEPFANATDNEAFVRNNFGQADPAYLTADQVPENLADTLFSMEAGTVYGPYLESGQYQLVKLVDRKVIPDSVRARHILIQADPANPIAVSQAQSTVDSLQRLIEAGTHSFDSLALQFGSDGTASKGGDLGFASQGMMVKPFNDLIFYEAELNELNTVQTQFGAHLVEVTDRKYLENEEGVRIALIGRSIVPSEPTIREAEREALNFLDQVSSLSEMEAAAADDPNLDVTVSAALLENDFFIPNLGGGQTSRDIVRWLFGNDPNVGAPAVGGVSPTLYRYQDQQEFFTNKFVAAALSSIRPAGPAEVDDVREEIRPAVLNRKKAEQVKAALAGNTDLSAIAGQYGVTVDTASNVTFAANFVTGLGSEPKVIGRAFGLEVNEVSEPITGNGGIYVVKPIYKPAATTAVNIPQVRSANVSAMRSQITSQLINALKVGAEVDDRRSNFF